MGGCRATTEGVRRALPSAVYRAIMGGGNVARRGASACRADTDTVVGVGIVVVVNVGIGVGVPVSLAGIFALVPDTNADEPSDDPLTAAAAAATTNSDPDNEGDADNENGGGGDTVTGNSGSTIITRCVLEPLVLGSASGGVVLRCGGRGGSGERGSGSSGGGGGGVSGSGGRCVLSSGDFGGDFVGDSGAGNEEGNADGDRSEPFAFTDMFAFVVSYVQLDVVCFERGGSGEESVGRSVVVHEGRSDLCTPSPVLVPALMLVPALVAVLVVVAAAILEAA